MAHLKGQNVNLLIGGSVIAASTSCDFSISPNTTDAASKSDADAMWDNPEFTYYDWSASNESFVTSIANLRTLLNTVINGTAEVKVQFQAGVGTSKPTGGICKKGTAIISSLSIDAANGDYAKLNISLEGASALISGLWDTIQPATTDKLRGKGFMIAINTAASGEAADYNTICAATSHKLDISVQTADVKTKDDNDKAILKEVTGKSIKLSTENLVNIIGSDHHTKCVNAEELLDKALNGDTIALQFGYYAASIGEAVGTGDTWGGPTTLLISGDCLCSSYSISGPNKDNASMSAEFAFKGKPTLTTTD